MNEKGQCNCDEGKTVKRTGVANNTVNEVSFLNVDTGPKCGLTIEQWKELAAKQVQGPQTQPVPGMGHEYIFARNRAITQAYANMYNSDPVAFKWAGMASFASCEVGKGMRQAIALRDSGLPILPGMTYLGTDILRSLEYGNAAIYMDIFWQHLAYQRCGIKELRRLQGQEGFDKKLFDAWDDIDCGRKTSHPTLVWKGNKALLQHEQADIIQRMYDMNRPMWKQLSSAPTVWFQKIESPIPGDHVAFQDFMVDGDIGSYADRWKWIDGRMLSEWQKLDAEPSRAYRLMNACGNR